MSQELGYLKPDSSIIKKLLFLISRPQLISFLIAYK